MAKFFWKDIVHIYASFLEITFLEMRSGESARGRWSWGMKPKFQWAKKLIRFLVETIFCKILTILLYIYISWNFSFLLVSLESKVEKILSLGEFWGWLEGKSHRLCYTGLGDSKSQRKSKPHHWFKSYNNFSGSVDLVY